MVIAGVTAGLAGATLAARGMDALLWGVAPTDVSTYVAVTGLLLAIAILAHIVPIRRALTIDPAIALRQE